MGERPYDRFSIVCDWTRGVLVYDRDVLVGTFGNVDDARRYVDIQWNQRPAAEPKEDASE